MTYSIDMDARISVTRLKRIYHPDGDILHGMKSTEATFSGFGEAYFSTVFKGAVKGWKRHNKMVLNLVVPCGEVAFHIYDERTKITTRIALGEMDYKRLTVGPGLWVAFEGLGGSVNLVLNIASIEHDSNESDTKPLNAFYFNRETF